MIIYVNYAQASRQVWTVSEYDNQQWMYVGERSHAVYPNKNAPLERR